VSTFAFQQLDRNRSSKESRGQEAVAGSPGLLNAVVAVVWLCPGAGEDTCNDARANRRHRTVPSP